MQRRILFLVQQRGLERTIVPALGEEYAVSVVSLRREAMQCLAEAAVDLLLIDLPSVRFDVHRFVASVAESAQPPVLFFLLGKGMRLDQWPQAHGHLRHPFSVRQLISRLERVLPAPFGETVEWNRLCLDVDRCMLIWGTNQVPLTPKQAALARAFISAPSRLLSRAHLMQEVWGTDFLGDTRTLDVHLHWLRRSLLQLQAPFVIQTQRGDGYRIVDLPSST